MRLLLNSDPVKRYTPEQALEHPWITDLTAQGPDSFICKQMLKNMKEFSFQYKLQEAILSMICHRFVVREDQDNLERTFLQFDADHDGVISFHEFVFAFEHYYFNAVEEMTKEELK